MQTAQTDLKQLIGTTRGADAISAAAERDADLSNQRLNRNAQEQASFGETLRRQLEADQTQGQVDESAATLPVTELPEGDGKGTGLPLLGNTRQGLNEGGPTNATEQRSDDISELTVVNSDSPIAVHTELNANASLPQTLAQSVAEESATSVAGAKTGLLPNAVTTTNLAYAAQQGEQSIASKFAVDSNTSPDTRLSQSPELTARSDLANVSIEVQPGATSALPNGSQSATLSSVAPTHPAQLGAAQLAPQVSTTPAAPVPADKPVADLQLPIDARLAQRVNEMDDARLIPPAIRAPVVPPQGTSDIALPQNAVQTDSQAAANSVISRVLERMWSEGFRVSAPVTHDSKLVAGHSESLSAITTDVAELFSAESASLKPVLSRAAPTAFSQVMAQYQLHAQPGTQAWGNELNQRVVWLAQQSENQQALLQLNPRHLGPMEVHITVNHEQQVSVSFTAQNATVREAIDAALPRLREMLDQQGLNLADANVSDKQPRDREQSHNSSIGRDMDLSANDDNESPGIEALSSVITEASDQSTARVDLYA